MHNDAELPSTGPSRLAHLPRFQTGQYQAGYQERWGTLRDPHVRALAWLIDAPGLLDASDQSWQGKIASLCADAGEQARTWLEQLDRQPQALHAMLARQPTARLGRYAEKLMAFYFSHLGILRAHGLQINHAVAGNSATVGEFDFLLQDDAGLHHREFATKFYLLEKPDGSAETVADYFIGPNLADTLGAKMNKILQRQLALSLHPAALALLPAPVVSAQALVKGWLFYHGNALPPAPGQTAAQRDTGVGLASAHCHGFWCQAGVFQAELAAADAGQMLAILPRLSWLAPARLAPGDTYDSVTLLAMLDKHFETDTMPVMVALMAPDEDQMIEVRRGFIVPDDWRARASQRQRSPGLS